MTIPFPAATGRCDHYNCMLIINNNSYNDPHSSLLI